MGLAALIAFVAYDYYDLEEEIKHDKTESGKKRRESVMRAAGS